MKKVELFDKFDGFYKKMYDHPMQDFVHFKFGDMIVYKSSPDASNCEFYMLEFKGVAVGCYSLRTGSMYVVGCSKVSIRNAIYKVARCLYPTRIVHLDFYRRRDRVIETYIDGRNPWKLNSDQIEKIIETDFDTIIQNRW